MEPPAPAELHEVDRQGRFKPNQLDVPSLAKLEVGSGPILDWNGTPSTIVRKTKESLQASGFEIEAEREAQVQPHAVLSPHGRVTGIVAGERGLRAYRQPKKRGDLVNALLIGTGVACILVAFSNFLIGTPHFLPFLASLGLLTAGGLLCGAPLLTIGRMDFWSDVAIVEYESTGEVDRHLASPSLYESSYRIHVSAGRGWTRNWQSKAGMGRSLEQLVQTPELDRLSKKMAASIGENSPTSSTESR